MSEDEEELVCEFKSERFEFSFMKIPFVVTPGTIVRDVTDRYYGVIISDTKDWDRYMLHAEKVVYYDFADVQLEVYFLTEDGVWVDSHVNPIYLEKEDHPQATGDKKSEAYIRAANSFAEYWKASGDRNESARRAIQYAKEYRDVCLEERIFGFKQQCSRIDNAESIFDIMV